MQNCEIAIATAISWGQGCMCDRHTYYGG